MTRAKAYAGERTIHAPDDAFIKKRASVEGGEIKIIKSVHSRIFET